MLSCNAAGIPATVKLFDQIDLHRRIRIPVAWAYSFDILIVLLCLVLYLSLLLSVLRPVFDGEYFDLVSPCTPLRGAQTGVDSQSHAKSKENILSCLHK